MIDRSFKGLINIWQISQYASTSSRSSAWGSNGDVSNVYIASSQSRLDVLVLQLAFTNRCGRSNKVGTLAAGVEGANQSTLQSIETWLHDSSESHLVLPHECITSLLEVPVSDHDNLSISAGVTILECRKTRTRSSSLAFLQLQRGGCRIRLALL